jgi:hypothetical protein
MLIKTIGRLLIAATGSGLPSSGCVCGGRGPEGKIAPTFPLLSQSVAVCRRLCSPRCLKLKKERDKLFVLVASVSCGGVSEVSNYFGCFFGLCV